MDPDIMLGHLIPTTERRRDAIHIALAPVTAAQNLMPGQHVGFTKPGNTELVGPGTDQNIGIVDPFIGAPIRKGQRFWLCLYPGTITGLRHAWTHPAFTAAAQARREDP